MAYRLQDRAAGDNMTYEAFVTNGRNTLSLGRYDSKADAQETIDFVMSMDEGLTLGWIEAVDIYSPSVHILRHS